MLVAKKQPFQIDEEKIHDIDLQKMLSNECIIDYPQGLTVLTDDNALDYYYQPKDR